MKKFIILSLLCLSAFFSQAQEKKQITQEDYTNSEVPMADNFRAEGKIYVLTAVILVILGGLVGYMVTVDRKIGKIEKQLPNNNG